MRTKIIIYERHKGFLGVGKLEGLDYPLKKTEFGLEGDLPCIINVHANLMVASYEVLFGK